MPAVPPPSASQPSILLEQASPATDPPSVRKPEVGKASIRQGNHPYYQVAGKPPIRQPPQPTHQSPIIQMRKPVRSNLSKMKKPHLQRQKPLFSSLAFSSSPPQLPGTRRRAGSCLAPPGGQVVEGVGLIVDQDAVARDQEETCRRSPQFIDVSRSWPEVCSVHQQVWSLNLFCCQFTPNHTQGSV